jgi:undecaprenyl-diphosphatase
MGFRALRPHRAAAPYAAAGSSRGSPSSRRPALDVLFVQAVVLALVQGLAGILPVSGSGHREGVLYLAAWEGGDPAFELSLYLGTLVALVAYFRGDLAYLVTRTLAIGGPADVEQAHARRTVTLLVVASVPAGLAAWWFEPPLTTAWAQERVVAIALYATALALVGAEWLRRRRVATELGCEPGDLSRTQRRADTGRDEGTTTFGDAAGVGVAQALAVVPGISRTGMTIAAGMALGLSRTGAARLALLLSIPVVAGAVLGRVGDLGASPTGTAPFGAPHQLVGFLVAAGSAYWAIRFLLRLVQTDDLLGFARWVALFATLILFASFLVIG